MAEPKLDAVRERVDAIGAVIGTRKPSGVSMHSGSVGE